MANTDELIQMAREEVEAFNAADWGRFQSTYTPDAIYDEFPTQRHIEGSDRIREANEQWKQTFPDGAGEITSVTASGDTVTMEVTWSGTQSGALIAPEGELPATNRRAEVKAVQVMKFADNHIKENH